MRTHPTVAIQQALRRYFPQAQLHLLDGEYATLTPAAWAGAHSDYIDRMWAKGLPEWMQHKGDCDDWAWLFRAEAIERNWKQHASRVALAIFYLHYTTREGVLHAINAVVLRGGDFLYIAPLEPQPDGGLIDLTEQERVSCTLIIG